MKTIERLRELEAKATDAPWHSEYGNGMYIDGPAKKEVATACGCCDGCTGDNCENDRPFIIEMRNAIPALLAVVEAADAMHEAGVDPRNAAAGKALGELALALRALEGGA